MQTMVFFILTKYTIINLTNNTQYSISVSAVNSVGESEKSEEVLKAPTIGGDDLFYLVNSDYDQTNENYYLDLYIYNVEAISGNIALKFDTGILKNGVFLKNENIEFVDNNISLNVIDNYHVLRWVSANDNGINSNIIGGLKLGTYKFDLSMDDYLKQLNNESIQVMDWTLTQTYIDLESINPEENTKIWATEQQKYKVKDVFENYKNISLILNYDKVNYYSGIFTIKENSVTKQILSNAKLYIYEDSELLYALTSDSEGVCIANSFGFGKEYTFRTELYGYGTRNGSFAGNMGLNEMEILLGTVVIVSGKAGPYGKVKIGIQELKNGDVSEVIGNDDSSSIFTFVADEGYEIDKVLRDGVLINTNDDLLTFEYVFVNVNKSSSVSVTFKPLKYKLKGNIKYVKTSVSSSIDRGSIVFTDQFGTETPAVFTQNPEIGSFEVELIAGIYSVKIIKPGYTSYTITGIEVLQSFDLPKDIELIPGDASLDDVVSMVDFSIILAGIREYQIRGDINENGFGDIIDLGYAKSNYSKKAVEKTWEDYIL